MHPFFLRHWTDHNYATVADIDLGIRGVVDGLRGRGVWSTGLDTDVETLAGIALTRTGSDSARHKGRSDLGGKEEGELWHSV